MFLQLLSTDNTCFCMTIAFWHWLMSYACMLYTPTHTIPNKSHLGEGLGAFPNRGNHHLLSHWNKDCVWSDLFLICGGQESSARQEFFAQTSFVSFTVFRLSTLSNVKIATYPCSLLASTWMENLFSSIHFQPLCVHKTKWISCWQHIVGT